MQSPQHTLNAAFQVPGLRRTPATAPSQGVVVEKILAVKWTPPPAALSLYCPDPLCLCSVTSSRQPSRCPGLSRVSSPLPQQNWGFRDHPLNPLHVVATGGNYCGGVPPPLLLDACPRGYASPYTLPVCLTHPGWDCTGTLKVERGWCGVGEASYSFTHWPRLWCLLFLLIKGLRGVLGIEGDGELASVDGEMAGASSTSEVGGS